VIRIECSGIIHNPREAAFAVAANAERQLEWDPETLKSVQKLTPGPLGRETRYRGRFKQMGTVEWGFPEFNAPERFTQLARIKFGQMRHTFVFDPTDEGTRLTQIGELTPNLVGQLMAPVFKRMLAKRFQVIVSELDAYLSKAGSAKEE
jgi:polyketide cyclase/dehydrase/lipid transport protein